MATQKLEMAFVTLIIGISLIGVVATTTSTASDLALTQNETFDISAAKNAANASAINTTSTISLTNAYASTDWQYDTCDVSVTLLAIDNGTAATVTTDYVVGGNGEINLTNSAFWHTESMNNDTLITYNYCQDGYLTEGWSRTVLDIVPGFFAIALLMVSLGLFYSVAKDTGII